MSSAAIVLESAAHDAAVVNEAHGMKDLMRLVGAVHGGSESVGRAQESSVTT
jgi:hypothetical protein